ncbi:hypothetical protein AB0N05_34905 [Nocardia sp. NPDC051030]|uniref:hypothetical protein n=1 Tax=Nocardia sp. NPDC051030 TaxID=3155162 RepID=UPI0034453F0D
MTEFLSTGARRMRRARERRVTAGIGGAGLMLAMSVFLTGCGGSPDAVRPQSADIDRGRLAHAEHLRTFSTEDVAAELANEEFDTGAVRFGVDTYRLVYETVDPTGGVTTASGLLALPSNGVADLTAVAFEHGTMATKAFGPSVSDHGGELAATITYASAGFAGVTPDYLGLGLGPGPHPYMDVPSATTASLDMLRAARTYVTGVGRTLRPEVDITGFSQGGPAAMDLARTIQGGADNGFRAAAVAAISGPFDLTTAEFPALLSNSLDPTSAVFYSAYFLVAWNRLHHLYQSPNEVFQPPYDQTVEQLFDGSHTEQDIVENLPTTLDALLTPHAIDMLRNPTGELATAVQIANGTCRDWTPQMPIRLYTGSKDRDVIPDNSAHCQTSLREHTPDAQLIDIGDVNHMDSGRKGTAAAVRWFTELVASK